MGGMNTRRAQIVLNELLEFMVEQDLRYPDPSAIAALNAALAQGSSHSLPVHPVNNWGIIRLQIEFHRPHFPTVTAYNVRGSQVASFTHVAQERIWSALATKFRFSTEEVLKLFEVLRTFLKQQMEPRSGMDVIFGIRFTTAMYGIDPFDTGDLYKRLRITFTGLDHSGRLCQVFHHTGQEHVALTKELNQRFHDAVEF